MDHPQRPTFNQTVTMQTSAQRSYCSLWILKSELMLSQKIQKD